jgi:hypothetical protein
MSKNATKLKKQGLYYKPVSHPVPEVKPGHTPGKGKKGENCNVTACQKPKSAHHYNNIMHAYYCRECATEIQRFAVMDGMSFYDDL